MTEWKNGIAKITLPTPFRVGDVHVYLIRGDKLTLIDAGVNTEEAKNALIKQLGELQLTPNDVDQVILTHHHPDHMGLVDLFPKTTEILGHELNQRWLMLSDTFLKGNEAFFTQIFQEFGVPEHLISLSLKQETNQLKTYSCKRNLSGFLKEGDDILGLEGWNIIETPGHATSHICLFREKDGVFIGGDLLLQHISPTPILEPPIPGDKLRPLSQLELNASLQKIAQHPIQHVYPGHGDDMTEAAALIEMRLTRQHERAMQVKKWLVEEELTVFEICQRLFPRSYGRELLLTMSETIGHLDYLLSLEEINIINNEYISI